MITVLFTGGELRQRRRETMAHPPEDVRYESMMPVRAMRPDFLVAKTPERKTDFRALFREHVIYPLKVPNIRYVPQRFLKGIDVIHTPGQVLLNRKPYIIEIENVAALGFYNIATVRRWRGFLSRFLKSKKCKQLMCLSEASRQSVIRTFRDPAIEAKTTVIYPYVALNMYENRRVDDGKTVILTGVNPKFYMKGTRDVLSAFEQLTKRHDNLELRVVSNTPKEYLERYKNFGNIKFFEAKFTKDELYRDFYSQCDIFAQASYQDSLGLTYLEVAASGKPIVTTDIFATGEAVVDGETGFLIKAPFYMHNPDFTLKDEYFPMRHKDTELDFYKKVDGRKVVDALVEKLSILIENEALRKKMGEEALKLVKSRFSEEERKRRLKEMYTAAAQ